MKLKNRISSFLARLFLSNPRLRIHAIEEIKKKYFDLLDINIYLGKGLSIPFVYEDSLASFKEIFMDHCYSWFQPQKPCKRWLDIGCNNGYFTLDLARKQLENYEDLDISAFLVDGDKRSEKSVAKINRRYSKNVKTTFIHAAVGPKQEIVSFLNLSAMHARIGIANETIQDISLQSNVPVISEQQIMQAFPPPYDLIKTDIEGAEIDFLDNYPTLIRNTDTLIIEWHSWNSQNISQVDFEKKLSQMGFSTTQMSHNTFNTDGNPSSCADYLCIRN